MTSDQAKRLKVGDRVTWKGNAADCGEVVDTTYYAVEISWDNGKRGTIHVNDCKSISEVPR